MSRSFETAREGLNYDVYGGSVPNSMLYRIKQIEGLSKQTLSIVPSSGQGSVYNGNKIIVSLPMNSLLDLGTFEMNFFGKITFSLFLFETLTKSSFTSINLSKKYTSLAPQVLIPCLGLDSFFIKTGLILAKLSSSSFDIILNGSVS